MNSIAPLIEEANRVIREAIKHFGLQVNADKILVTIQTKGRKAAVGWFWAKRWKQGKDALNEINMSAECLKEHHMGELLLHELAHAENNAKEIKDCSSGQYHNKSFKSMAETLGLKVEKSKRFGWGHTDLDAGAIAFLDKISFKRELFDVSRLTPATKTAVGSRLLKCECPACGYVIRTTQKWLDVGVPTCPCGEEMEAA